MNACYTSQQATRSAKARCDEVLDGLTYSFKFLRAETDVPHLTLIRSGRSFIVVVLVVVVLVRVTGHLVFALAWLWGRLGWTR